MEVQVVSFLVQCDRRDIPRTACCARCDSAVQLISSPSRCRSDAKATLLAVSSVRTVLRVSSVCTQQQLPSAHCLSLSNIRVHKLNSGCLSAPYNLTAAGSSANTAVSILRWPQDAAWVICRVATLLGIEMPQAWSRSRSATCWGEAWASTWYKAKTGSSAGQNAASG